MLQASKDDMAMADFMALPVVDITIPSHVVIKVASELHSEEEEMIPTVLLGNVEDLISLAKCCPKSSFKFVNKDKNHCFTCHQFVHYSDECPECNSFMGGSSEDLQSFALPTEPLSYSISLTIYKLKLKLNLFAIAITSP